MDFSRKINLIGDIDETLYKEFVERMDECEEMLEGGDIFIELQSPGGDAQVALGIYDRIRNSKSHITIKAYGLVASAAVIILAAGDLRIMSQNSWVMVHEDTVPTEEEQRVSQIENIVKTSRRFEDQWNKIMASRTKISAKKWAALHEAESYLDANECMALGLIDEVE